jgi:hypothetical protein
MPAPTSNPRWTRLSPMVVSASRCPRGATVSPPTRKR